MTRLRNLFPILPLLLLFGAPASAQKQKIEKPLLWKIEGEKPSYLFGTIHVPDDRVTNLPDVVKNALDNADAFYAELKMDMGSQMSAAKKMHLPAGTTLKTMLPEELYARYKAYVSSKIDAMPMRALLLGELRPMMKNMVEQQIMNEFNKFKPQVVAAQLAMLDYLPDLQMGKKPLDAFLYSRAQNAGKEVGGLEKIEEQLAVFESQSDEAAIEALAKSLEQLEKAAKEGKKATDELMDIYLSGDTEAMEKKAKEEFDPNDADQAKMWKMLNTDRNIRMTDRIEEKLKANPGKSYFFAVGSLHYVGDEGIVALLKKKGFTVTRVTGDAPADAGKKSF